MAAVLKRLNWTEPVLRRRRKGEGDCDKTWSKSDVHLCQKLGLTPSLAPFNIILSWVEQAPKRATP